MAQLIRVNRWDEKDPNMKMEYKERAPNLETIYREVVVLINETSASLLLNERLHGISKNGKHWFKFSTPKKVIYTIKKDVRGENAGRIYFKEGRSFTNASQDVVRSISSVLMDSPNGEGFDIFSIAIRDVAARNGVPIPLGNSITSPTFMYPVLSHLKMPKLYAPRISNTITRHASTNDLGVFVYRAFGKTRYRKDLVKAVAGLSSMTVFTLGYSFRGLVPIDWIIDFYRKFAGKDPHNISHGDFLEDIHKGLRFLSQKQVRKLFKLIQANLMHTSKMELQDTIASIGGIGDEKYTENLHDIKFTTIKEAHDKFSTYYRLAAEISKNAKFAEPLELTSLSKDLTEVDSPDHTIRVIPAKYPKDLIEWGGKMGHCIASYTSDAIYGRGTYAGIYKNGELIGNVEFKRDKLSQIFGEYNRLIPNDILVEVAERFMEAGIDFKDIRGAYGFRDFELTDEFRELSKKYDTSNTNVEVRGPVDYPAGGWEHAGWAVPNGQLYVGPAGQQPFVPNLIFDGPRA